MKRIKTFKLAATFLIVLPLVIIGLRLLFNNQNSTQDYYELIIKSYVNNNDLNALVEEIEKSNPYLTAQVSSRSDAPFKQKNVVTYIFNPGPTAFDVDPELPLDRFLPPYVENFTGFGKLYPVENPELIAIVRDQMTKDSKALQVLKSLFGHAEMLSDSEVNAFGSLVEATKGYGNGDFFRSAYFATMCRIASLPARVVRGLELSKDGASEWRFWVEVRVAHLWVPFVPGTGEFASLPEGWVKLFNDAGQLGVWQHLDNIDFELGHVTVKPEKARFLTLLDVERISEHTGIPPSRLALILVLPLAALIVGIFKTIIGVKTMGIFLPALISLTLIDTGLLHGLLLFTGIVLTIATLHIPLSRWGIQYNAKLALMLTGVVVVALVIMAIGSQIQSGQAAFPLFFPFVILTIVSERVAAKAEESGIKTALELYGGSMLVTCIVYFVVATAAIQDFFLENPEIILSLAGVMLLLGKWIGMRVSEYYRFHKLSRFQ